MSKSAIPEFDNHEDAIEAWFNDAGPVEEVDVWVSPQCRVRLKVPKNPVPKIVVCSMVKDPESGQYFLRPMNWPFLVRLRNLPERMGWDVSEKTLRRLAYAGEIKMAYLTPQVHLVDLESLHNLLLRSMGRDDYWRGARLAMYQEAISVIK